ncbi:hypothetical protein HanPI659440_Chr17g0672821 [Helianthus annuus]|nr:hypothetical protein HanPI659440_Chr17g0672821 [Helianthus annuus]
MNVRFVYRPSEYGNMFRCVWFVFGDDDTVFFHENLVKTLSKYDHELPYFIGSNSESFIQNRFFSFSMAFGGAGFAISYPLAKTLAKVLDSCLERYHHLYGSDGRISSCLAELGVGITREPGFHQVKLSTFLILFFFFIELCSCCLC